jgi:two-component system response regulator BaeR
MTRIVIVEDETDIASVVQDYLRHAGYETELFTDGQSALESIVASPPDLTLLDIMLPRLDGIEVLRRAREHTAHPIIMLTARIEEVDRWAWSWAPTTTCASPSRHASWWHGCARCCAAPRRA